MGREGSEKLAAGGATLHAGSDAGSVTVEDFRLYVPKKQPTRGGCMQSVIRLISKGMLVVSFPITIFIHSRLLLVFSMLKVLNIYVHNIE